MAGASSLNTYIPGDAFRSRSLARVLAGGAQMLFVALVSGSLVFADR